MTNDFCIGKPPPVRAEIGHTKKGGGGGGEGERERERERERRKICSTLNYLH